MFVLLIGADPKVPVDEYTTRDGFAQGKIVDGSRNPCNF
jgi:hypothetical protein